VLLASIDDVDGRAAYNYGACGDRCILLVTELHDKSP
jgi:hypothetical protein